MEEAKIRYYCMIGPGADMQYAYLKALSEFRWPVRLLPIGPAHLQMPNEPQWKRWMEMSSLFMTPMSRAFVNIVCSPPSVPLGIMMTAKDFSGPDAGDESVYVPATAFGGLWTKGVPNVAITALSGKRLADKEAYWLSRYDKVICPSFEDAEALSELHISAEVIPMDRPALLVGAISKLVDSLEDCRESL